VGGADAEPAAPYGPDAGTGVPEPVNRRLAGVGMSVTWLATALLLVAIVLRGIAAGRAPWANMYEFALVGTFVAVAVFAGVNTRRDVRFLGAFVTGISVLFLVLAQQQFFVAATGVQPALQKYWLVIHVGVAICATGIFTVAFVTSVLQLLRDGRDNGSAMLGSRRWGWLDHTPAPSALESLSFRLNSVAFVLWTFTLIGGAIWAEDAWGRYWGWDPKEVWTFIAWVVYAAYLHARTTRGWSGTRAAWFVVAGYACVLFNFTGVNLVFDGKHSYSGL
jgi:cytochrome c-type biogenesis protein CcsB